MENSQDVLMWEAGAPKNKLFEEWFIARLDNGQKVVIKRLPEEYSYDFKTADDTYYKEFRIAKWMPFPESEFFSPTAIALLEALENAKQFIENGIELGYIRMPDADTPDSAHNTLPMINAAIAAARGTV